ncbi:hypothetical protein NPI37_005044, partial [Citrobacter freundii]
GKISNIQPYSIDVSGYGISYLMDFNTMRIASRMNNKLNEFVFLLITAGFDINSTAPEITAEKAYHAEI